MGSINVTSDQLAQRIAEDIAKFKDRVEAAIDLTVLESVGIIWQRVPFAFGELHNSIHVEGLGASSAGRAVVANAPHAAAVEVGSMPHMPPIAPLVSWAALRGSVDPERAAWAIAHKIARDGTKPTWYMRGSLPAIRRELHANIRAARDASKS